MASTIAIYYLLSAELFQILLFNTNTSILSQFNDSNILNDYPSAEIQLAYSTASANWANVDRHRDHAVVPADLRINLKECEKKDKYLDLARELKKLWNMKVTIVPIVSAAFGTITKGWLKGLEDLEVGGRVETIQMTALLRTTRILRRVLETWGDLLSFKLQWKTIS